MHRGLALRHSTLSDAGVGEDTKATVTFGRSVQTSPSPTYTRRHPLLGGTRHANHAVWPASAVSLGGRIRAKGQMIKNPETDSVFNSEDKVHGARGQHGLHDP